MASIMFDPDAKALYIKLIDENKKIAKTIPLKDGNYIDVSEDNQLIGIECILPQSIEKETYQVLNDCCTVSK